jgi:hypothetical protein
MAAVVPPVSSEEGTLHFGFEDGDLQGWQVVAGEFSQPVCQYGAQAGGKLPQSGEGAYYLTTNGAAMGQTGTDTERMGGVIESPVFVVQGDEATFLLGGVAAKLTLHTADGQQVRAASQWGPGNLKTVRWDVSKFIGQPVFLRLTDGPENGHGYACLDAFRVAGRIELAATDRWRKRLEQKETAALAAALEELNNVGEIVFAVRQPGKNGHYYVNFGNWCGNPNKWEYGRGGRLCRLDVRTGRLTTLIDDPQGGVRDPQVHYDGDKILFSYRPGKTHRYHLYEINIDGSGLRQLTDGPFDDIEPSYLPDGRIVFCSTRCNRIINCNLVQAALLFTCDGDGQNIRQISPNNETENTPWPLPDGRIVYTRWEYIDRGIGGFKALWTTNPDGTGQMTLYGNTKPAPTFLDAKPIPNSRSIVMINSTHMGCEHVGSVAAFDPSNGPDDRSSEQIVAWEGDCRDPYPVGQSGFLAARGSKIVLIGSDRSMHTVFELPEEDRRTDLWCHEPRLLKPRPREPVIPSRLDLTKETGVLMLADVYHGRNMSGVRRGEIKQLLVMETLPKAVNFSGQADPYSFDHSFNLNRVLGTVPVEEDGSAHVEVPAMRGIILAALDQDGLAVKRMQSFLTVQPGETVGCVGCHEQRQNTPDWKKGTGPICAKHPSGRSGKLDLSPFSAMRRPPSEIEPFEGVPDVFDFPRDIQPILDRHCARCHDYEASEHGGPRAGGAILTGDHGPVFSHSFATLHMLDQVVISRDGVGNKPPRGFGSGASPLMQLIDGSHYGAVLSDHERLMVRLWIDASATYAGTCAASGTGKFPSNPRLPSQPEANRVLQQRCGACHTGGRRLPKHPGDTVGVQGYTIVKDQLPRRMSNHLVFNLTRPEKSLILLAPLSKAGGGYGICRESDQAVFEDATDSDYQALLRLARESKAVHESDPRFDMPGFRPSGHYVRNMQDYGILPKSLDVKRARVDPYATDRAYWRSFWWSPCRDRVETNVR